MSNSAEENRRIEAEWAEDKRKWRAYMELMKIKFQNLKPLPVHQPYYENRKRLK